MWRFLLFFFIYFQSGVMENDRITRTTIGEFFDRETSTKQPVYEYTLRNGHTEVIMITYGATVKSITVPDKAGNKADVVLGFDDLQGYQKDDNPYMGATVGRVTNRVRNASFILDNVSYTIRSTNPLYSLHGGIDNFSKKNWDSRIDGDKVIFTLISKDGDEGFPGELTVHLTVQLTDDSIFKMEFEAQTTKKTIINLTNHAYFNLAGESTGRRTLYEHTITVNADYITETDKNFIPTGKLFDITNTSYDLRKLVKLADVLPKVPHGGLDNNYCIRSTEDRREIQKAATFHHVTSGRKLEVFSNQPGCQIYTANHLLSDPDDDTPRSGTRLIGKNGLEYKKHSGICFESQDYPDAINHPNFPSIILKPNEVYRRSIHWKFTAE